MEYLQFVGQKREKEDLVQMENLDRKIFIIQSQKKKVSARHRLYREGQYKSL